MEITATRKSFLLSDKAKDLIVFFICLICIFLFLSSAYDKLVEQSKFVQGLSRVAYIGGYAKLIGWLVPSVEIIISLLLMNPKTYRLGLYGFIVTMLVFTGYISSMLLWAEKLPCHCNLIIEKLTWGQHIWFNLAFVAMSGYALTLQKNSFKHKH